MLTNISPMNSLPPATDPTFRTKLREAREARNLSQYALAKLAGVALVMPKRYEDASDKYATLPNAASWAKLNAALFPAELEQRPGAPEAEPRANVTQAALGKSLDHASVEEIVAELKRRGAVSVIVNW